MRSLKWLGVTAALGLMLAAASDGPKVAQAEPAIPSVTGLWDINWGGSKGVMVAVQDGNVVCGTWSLYGGSSASGVLSSTLSGPTMAGRWGNTADEWGGLALTLAPTGRALNGTSGDGQSSTGDTLTGAFRSAITTPAAAFVKLPGTYDVEWGDKTVAMKLTMRGTTAEGTLAGGMTGTVRGQVFSNDLFIGTYTSTAPAESGRFLFRWYSGGELKGYYGDATSCVSRSTVSAKKKP